MSLTGIEPIFIPYQSIILPLNYKLKLYNLFIKYKILFFPKLRLNLRKLFLK